MTKEFLKMIRLDREELIGTMQVSKKSVLVHNPLKLMEFDNALVLAPWIPFNCSPIIKINLDKIVYGPVDIIEELKDLYVKFNEYYEMNPTMKYGQVMCKTSMESIQAVIESYKKGIEEIEKGVEDPQQIFTAGEVTPEQLDQLMEEVFDTPSKDKLN